MQDEVISELRLQTAILRAGFRKDLDALAESATSDRVSAAIIDHLREHGPTKSPALKEAIPKLVGAGAEASARTIVRRLSDLENSGVILRSGQSQNTEYTLSGLIS